ncbi:MAG TPA: hypothetical protein VI160_01150 [Gemmatimonadales bacterium]
MRRIIVVTLLTPIALSAAAAQDAPRPSRTINFGMVFAPGNLARGDRGAAMSGGFDHALGSRFGLRVQGMFAYVSAPPPVAYGLCPMGAFCGVPGRPGDVAVAGTTASGRFNIDSRDGGMYVSAGLGTYYFLSDPTRHGALRPGLSAGFGYELRVGTLRLALDANYQVMARDRSGRYWLLPVTVGVRF